MTRIGNHMIYDKSADAQRRGDELQTLVHENLGTGYDLRSWALTGENDVEWRYVIRWHKRELDDGDPLDNAGTHVALLPKPGYENDMHAAPATGVAPRADGEMPKRSRGQLIWGHYFHGPGSFSSAAESFIQRVDKATEGKR